MAIFGGGDNPGRKKALAVDTLVGGKTEIRGDVLFSGGLHVDGLIRGKVIATVGEPASLSISEQGTVEGDVSVPIMSVNGRVSGNVHATEKLTLAAAARVTGNLYYNVLEVQPGAEVNGQMVHDPNGDRAPTAIGEQRGDVAAGTIATPGTLPSAVHDLRRPKIAS